MARSLGALQILPKIQKFWNPIFSASCFTCFTWTFALLAIFEFVIKHKGKLYFSLTYFKNHDVSRYVASYFRTGQKISHICDSCTASFCNELCSCVWSVWLSEWKPFHSEHKQSLWFANESSDAGLTNTCLPNTLNNRSTWTFHFECEIQEAKKIGLLLN